MGLNIKNPRVHQLAQEAARVTGKTQTGAIEEALVRLLESHGIDRHEVEAAERLERVRRIVVDYVNDPGNPRSEIRSVEDLYDDTGLPA